MTNAWPDKEPAPPQPCAEADAGAAAPKRRRMRPFVDMVDDLKRRRPHYVSDWVDGFHSKVLASTLFMFFTSIAPAITFSAVLDTRTKEAGVSQLGPVEVIFSCALTSVIWAIFSGQPMCIVGVTGPVTIFTTAMYTLADALDYEFMPFYCWVQMWAGLMHVLLAISGACDLIHIVTRYSCETFGMLIATIYLVTGIRNLVEYFYDLNFEPALLSLILGLGTAWLALLLSGARGWSIFRKRPRELIADYGTSFSVALFCSIPYWAAYHLTEPGWEADNPGLGTAPQNATILTLDVPSTVAPTSGRSWLVNPGDAPVGAIFLALAPALILTVLFFFDHNVSSLLCQVPEFGLKKGTSYHWDFFVVGLMLIITGILGIPPVNGLIPQAPLHTDSLCEKTFKTMPDGKKVETIVGCHEQRVSNLMQGVLIGCTLAVIQVVGYLPIAALDGLFLYMGIASFGGNSFYQRILFYFTDRERVDARSLDFVGKVDNATIYKFTLLQLLVLGCIIGITLVPYVDALFPLCIAILVPGRLYLLPRWFGAENVDLMDAVGKPPEPVDDQPVDDQPDQPGAGQPVSLEEESA